MELVWYRMLGAAARRIGLHLRPHPRRRARRHRHRRAAVRADRPATGRRRSPASPSTCLLEAAAVAATFALGDRLALLALALLPLGAAGFAAAIAGWTLVTAIVVLPPAIVAGYQFPLLIALFGRGRERLGRQVGLAYAANTAGAIVGSLAGGFGLLPWLSAPGAWRLVAVVLVALGVAAAVLDAERNAASREAPVASRSLCGRCARVLRRSRSRSSRSCCSRPPGRRPSGATAASAPAARRATSSRRRTSSAPGSRPSAARSSGRATASKAASRWPPKQTGYAFIVNGKSDGSARGDAGTQVMLGLLGALLHPAAAPRAGHRPRHRQHRRLARRDPVDGARRRRRARAAGPRRRARVRGGQPRRRCTTRRCTSRSATRARRC